LVALVLGVTISVLELIYVQNIKIIFANNGVWRGMPDFQKRNLYFSEVVLGELYISMYIAVEQLY
jgi:DNA-binding cell septation regulator SpoVG